MHHTRCYQIVGAHATNLQIATKVHLTGKHGTWKKPFETVSKPLSSRNQNKFPSLTPRTTKHFQCFSYHPKTSLFQKTHQKKLTFSKNQSSRKYPLQEYQKMHLRKPLLQTMNSQKPNRLHMKLNIAPV